MAERQTSTGVIDVTTVAEALRLLFSAVCSLLLQATLPITQHLFSRVPLEPSLLATDIRIDKVHFKVFPRLTSVFNVETYELQHRCLGAQEQGWQFAELCTNASPGAEVGGLQEFTEYEVRIQASNSKGCSEWSKPLRVLTKRRAVEGGCDCGLYKWTQTRSEVVIHVAVPKSVSGKDVAVTLKEHRYLEIQARIGIQDVRRVEGLLRRPVKDIGNGSTWELTSEDCCKVVTVTLEKEDIGKPVWWTSALRGHPEIDLHTIPGYDPAPYDLFNF